MLDYISKIIFSKQWKKISIQDNRSFKLPGFLICTSDIITYSNGFKCKISKDEINKLDKFNCIDRYKKIKYEDRRSDILSIVLGIGPVDGFKTLISTKKLVDVEIFELRNCLNYIEDILHSRKLTGHHDFNSRLIQMVIGYDPKIKQLS